MKLKKHSELKAKKLYWAVLGVVFGLQLGGSAAFAQPATKAPAQSPLVVVQSGVAPNIMLIFDDSSSMTSMHPSDSGYQGSLYFHPEDRGSSYSGYTSRVYYAPSDPNEIVAAVTRSPQVNSLYYNPAVTYKPWANADGSLMPDLNPAAVPVFITDSSFGTLDLTFTSKDYYFTDASHSTADRAAGLLSYDRRMYTNANGYNNRGTHTITSPAIYFTYHGPDANDPNFNFKWSNANIRNIANYTPTVITAIGSGGITQPATRTDCAVENPDGTKQCTRAEELQNFANWYGYYRGRTRTAIAALTHVFAKDFGMQYRLGWASLSGSANIDGTVYSYIKQGVRPFEGSHADAFYARLRYYERYTPNGTPTRAALDVVGQYFERTDDKGPWGAVPGSNDSTPHLACRKSYAILMTDGGWNGAAGSVASNYDRQAGNVITGPNGQSYQYTPSAPYASNYGAGGPFLSDVAMYYWNRDLRPDLTNIVVPTSGNEAFWQHMVTHTIGFGTTGTFRENDWPALQAGTRQWGTDKFDDLWHAAVNGHGTFSSASNIENLIKSLSSIMENMALAEVPAPHSVTSTQYLETTNRVYAPSYQTAAWVGELTSYRLGSSGGLGSVEWRASESLTEATAASRNIWVGTGVTDSFSYTGGSHAGKNTVAEFRWSALSSAPAVRTALNNNENLLRYLRGEAVPASENFRVRASLLGDIVNSSPVYVKSAENLGYASLPGSATNNMGGYSSYLRNKDSRDGVVFVGANDGMLHAFATDGANAGKEVFAYIPNSVVSKLPELASNTYENTHQYYVDGPLTLTDIYWYAHPSAPGVAGKECLGDPSRVSCWRNILLGSTGAGARSVFALDVTDPSMYTGSPTASDISKMVAWELSPDPSNPHDKMRDMGYVMQPLQAGYTKAGDWSVIFGNGPYSHSGKAVLFIVNARTGTEVKTIQVGNAAHNGLMGVTLIRDNNQVVIGAYAGDLQGNLWRFDFPSTWGWDAASGVTATKLFTTDNGRPITHQPVYVPHPMGGRMVVFGTGKFYDTADLADSGMDYLYGVWDNGGAVDRSTLLRRATTSTALPSGQVVYGVDNQAMNWNINKGWSIPLNMQTAQRNLYKPTVLGSSVVFNTTLTNGGGASADPCALQNLNSITILVNLFSGGSSGIQFDTNGDGVIDSSDGYYIGYPSSDYGPGSTLLSPDLASSNPEFSSVNCGSGILVFKDGMPLCVGSRTDASWSQLF